MALTILVTLEKELPEAFAAYTKGGTGKALARESDRIDSAARRRSVTQPTSLLSESPASLIAHADLPRRNCIHNHFGWGEHPMAAARPSGLLCAMKESKILPAKGPAREAIQWPTNVPPRILVVEDDADIRRLNTEVLSDSGYQVDAAKDSQSSPNSVCRVRSVTKFGDTHPNVELDIVIEATRRAVPALIADEVDLAIVTQPPTDDTWQRVPVVAGRM